MATKKYFVDSAKDRIDYYTGNGYSLIKSFYRDPNNSFFKTNSQDEYFVRAYWCKCPDTCEAYKKGQCALQSGLWGENCPFGARSQMTGPTKRAKTGFDFLNEVKEVLKFDSLERENHGKNLESIKASCKIGNGDYVYLNLNYLDNYVNPIADSLGIVAKKFLPIENFNENTVRILLNYHPQAMFGGEIKNYQKEDVPFFVRDLKRHFKDLYKTCVIGTEFEQYGISIDYTGKKAAIQTLLPGKVKIDGRIWNWDGEQISIIGKELSYTLGEELVYSTPKPNTYAEVVDNDTVDEIKTVFKDI